MNVKEQAAALVYREQPIEAAQAYETVIASGEAELDTYLNLAVLYFVCTDGGYATAWSLPTNFINVAGNRMFALLNEAEQRFGMQAEIEFWKKYFAFISLGEEPFDDACTALVECGTSLVPFFYLFAFTGPEGKQYRLQAEQLLLTVSAELTEKERYIKSVLEAAFRRQTQP